MISKADAQALANFTRRIRDDWDYAGLMAAIGRCQNFGYAATSSALLKLADDHNMRTPALLAEPGAHWGGTSQAAQKAPVTCPEHEHEKAGACRICERAATPRPADFYEQMDRAREQARIQREFDREQGKSPL